MVSETACRDCYEADPLCPFIVITALYMNQLNSVLLFTKHATTDCYHHHLPPAPSTRLPARATNLFCSDDDCEVGRRAEVR